MTPVYPTSTQAGQLEEAINDIASLSQALALAGTAPTSVQQLNGAISSLTSIRETWQETGLY